MTEALRRVRNSRAEKTGARRRGHPASGNSSVYSDAEYEMVEDVDIFTEAPWQQEQTGQTYFEWKFEDTAFSKMHVSHGKSDRWFFLEQETTRSTELS